MAIRTTEEAVQGIIEAETSISLTPFIASANMLVTKCCAGEDYTTDELEMIERWLSAHFYAIRDPRLSSRTMGAASESFHGSVGMNLEATIYGQQAMLLDYYGGLAALSKKMSEGGGGKNVGISWLGTEVEDNR